MKSIGVELFGLQDTDRLNNLSAIQMGHDLWMMLYRKLGDEKYRDLAGALETEWLLSRFG